MVAVCKAAFLFLIIVVTAACQPYVRTHITTYQNSDATPLTGDIFIKPPEVFKGSALEFSFYKKKLAQRLRAIGLTPVEDSSAPYVAVMQYGVTRQEKENPSPHLFWGGHYGFSRRSGTTVIINDDSEEFENVRHLSLSIQHNTPAEGKSAEELLNVSAQSTGSCGHLSVVIDEMLDAIFLELYRPDGSIKKVKVKGSARCP